MVIDASKGHVAEIGLKGDYFTLKYATTGYTKEQVRQRLRDIGITLKSLTGYKRLRVRHMHDSIKITVRFDPVVSIMFADDQVKRYIGMTEAVVEERLGMDPSHDDGIE